MTDYLVNESDVVPDVRRFAIGEAGAIEGLSVCGIHGHLNRATTPAVRWPIYRTADGSYVTRLAPNDNPDQYLEGKLCPRIDARQAQLTWVGPWPASYDWLLLSLGDEERTLAASRLAELPAMGTSPSPEATHVLHWLAGRSSRSPAHIHGPDDDGNVLWYAHADAVFDVRAWLVGVGRTDLYRKVRDGIGDMRLANRAYWLSRCALGASDVALAAAALTLAGGDGKENVLRYGAMDASDEQKDRLFEGHRVTLAQALLRPGEMGAPAPATGSVQLATGTTQRMVRVVEKKEAPSSARGHQG